MTKCPKCNASTDGAFCGVCGSRVQAAAVAIGESQEAAAEYMPLAIATAVPTLGGLFWMLGGVVFGPIGSALVAFGGLLIVVIGALNISLAKKKAELVAVLVLWTVATLPNSVAAFAAGNDVLLLSRAAIWHMLVSFGALLVREYLLVGKWLPTTKVAKIVSAAIALQLLMAFVLITVLYSRMPR